MKRGSFRNNLGYNLIEAALVLGIAGVVIGGIFAAWGAVNSQNKMRRAQDQVTLILNQIRSTYGNRNQLDNATGQAFTDALVNAGLLPESWQVTSGSNTYLSNPYGGNVLITPANAPASSLNDAINITLSHVGKADCLKLASNMLGVGRTDGLFKIDSTSVLSNSTFKDVASGVCTTQTVSFYFTLKTGT